MPFDDELPQAPTAPTSGTSAPAEFDSNFDSSLLEGVPGLSDPIPQGTYHFRLEKYEKKTTAAGQPAFSLQWKCQQEPHVGRMAFDWVNWVSAEDVKAAQDPTNPRCQEAREAIRKNMPRAKAIMDAAGYKPSGGFNFETFLATNPEVKLQLGVSERRSKDAAGKYTVPTGQMQNSINTYLSLQRPS